MEEKTVTLPKSPWYREFADAYGAGVASVFCLTGDINGLTTDGASQMDYLKAQMSKRPIVMVFDREGFSFTREAGRKLANQLLGVKRQPSAMEKAVMSQMGQQEESADWFGKPRSISDGLRLIERLLTVISPENEGQPKEKWTVSEKGAFRQIAVIIREADLFLTDAPKNMMDNEAKDALAIVLRWGLSAEINRSECPIFLCSPNREDLHADIRSSSSGIKFIDISLPSLEERAAFVQQCARNYRVTFLQGLTEQEFVNTAAGINNRGIEDVFLAGTRAGGITREMLMEYKQELINREFGAVVDVLTPFPGGLNAIGGMEDIKAFLRKKVIEPLRRGSTRAAKGILLSGPPGTGKTLLTLALASDLGFNALGLKMSKISSKYVGESERNLASLLKVVKAMAPVVLFIDEIDQTDLSKRGGDSGNPVASNLFNEILTFLGDRWLTGRVVVIAATNRADLLDDALIRPGRLNPVIPILLPNKEDRIEIYRAQGRYQGVRIDEEAIAYAASASVDYSAADIESVVSKACDLAEEEGMEGIDEATIKLALSYIQAQSPQTAKLYTDIALIKCTDRQFLPKTVAISDQATMRGEIVEAASELGITTGFSRGSRRESF